MIFNAHSLAKAWLSVALAQSDNKGRPALYRTTLLETFPTGVRLVSTDSFLILKAWVPTVMWKDSPEPQNDELPEEVAICRDVDMRVLGLMKYALKLTQGDGDDTTLRIKMGVGDAPALEGQLDGLSEETVWFQFEEHYDERIEVKQFEGSFPEWRGVWFGHKWQTTGLVTFSANAFNRLGKLASLWGSAALRFHLGGQSGIAKVVVLAKGVNVSGLAMPLRDLTDDDSTDAEAVEMPASDEGLDAQYASEVERFLADVFATEQASVDTAAVDDAVEAQITRAAKVCLEAGYGAADLLCSQLGVNPDRAGDLIRTLVSRGVLGEGDNEEGTVRQAMELVVRGGLAQASVLQRKMSVSSARAKRLLEQLEQRGVVGPANGSKGREVLMTVEQLDKLPEVDQLEKYVVLVTSIDEPEAGEEGTEEPI